jgi:hypothetical protein
MFPLSAKRKRALLGSNPPRNSRPETHGDAAGVDVRMRLLGLALAERWSCRITEDFRMP